MSSDALENKPRLKPNSKCVPVLQGSMRENPAQWLKLRNMDTVLNSSYIVEENIVIIITMQYYYCYIVQPSKVKEAMCSTTVWSS